VGVLVRDGALELVGRKEGTLDTVGWSEGNRVGMSEIVGLSEMVGVEDGSIDGRSEGAREMDGTRLGLIDIVGAGVSIARAAFRVLPSSTKRRHTMAVT